MSSGRSIFDHARAAFEAYIQSARENDPFLIQGREQRWERLDVDDRAAWLAAAKAAIVSAGGIVSDDDDRNDCG